MFSLKIVNSDAFLDMPVDARELYFQLGMHADDDGFVNPRKIMRMTGASEDALKMLILKRFVLPFDGGVLVIKHWKSNNYIKSDRYEETRYKELKETLFVNKNGDYTDNKEHSIQNVSKMYPQVRLGKDRLELGKDIYIEKSKIDNKKTPSNGLRELQAVLEEKGIVS